MSLMYFDHHATTPCAQPVLDAMWPYFSEQFGNAASRTHRLGLEARTAVEHARGQVAALINASPKEIVWTSGATEANNLAVLGAAMAKGGGHLIVSAIEHKAVLDPAEHLRGFGFDVTVVPVGSDGIVNPHDVGAALRDDTVLVSIMMANNEIGTVQPIAEIGARTRQRGVPLHVDAVQGAGNLPIDVVAMNVDLMSLTAHKMYGPKGIGCLYVRRGRPKVQLEPLFHGGGQERGHRSGTLAVPLIVGMGVAAELGAGAVVGGEPARQAALRDRLLAGLTAGVDGVSVNGSMAARLPHNLNISIADVEAEALMMNLRHELAVSSGSACSSETLTPSFVLKAIGTSDALAFASVRFGLGRSTTVEQVDRAVELVCSEVQKLRALSPSHGLV